MTLGLEMPAAAASKGRCIERNRMAMLVVVPSESWGEGRCFRSGEGFDVLQKKQSTNPLARSWTQQAKARRFLVVLPLSHLIPFSIDKTWRINLMASSTYPAECHH